MKPANPRILTINCGSSSIKFALFEAGDSFRCILEGGIERIAQPEAALRAKGLNGADNSSQSVTAPDHTAAVNALMDWIEERSGRDVLTAVGHRVVHGGPKYCKPQRITAELVKELHRLSPFDPEHLPAEILLVEAFDRRFPGLPQVACFDTAFHHDLPRVARILPIPRRYEALGVRRYGFHGLSYAFLMEELDRQVGTEAAQGRVILAHLGNGASLAAVHRGKPVDTSMSFTPTAGVPMSTRSGDLDPGLVWYLAYTEQMSAKQFNEMVNSQSGLLGISETSSDMRDLLKCEAQDMRAAEAVELFCYQVKKWIGSFAAALGGLDTLVFAGGIGENAPIIRTRICDGLGFLGIQLEEERNAANEGVISAATGGAAVRVIHTDEGRMIATMVSHVLGLGMAATLDAVVAEIGRIQTNARANGFKTRPLWPMIILRSPKGWTGPKVIDGKPTEGTFRSHQVPMGDMSHPGHVKILEEWLQSYRPQELFDQTGKLCSELAELAPKGERRMSANPHANGGRLLEDLRLPDFREFAMEVASPGAVNGEATRVQGQFIRDVVKLNPTNFRVFSPDEVNSNRWGALFEVTNRCSTAEILPGDDHVAPDGRVMEILSEHQCEGWLEGYLLTGRHGFFSCYEAFIHIVDSMFNQHAKWLDVARGIPWRRPIASLNYLLSSHVWRQDHNGFSHQDPGFIDVVANKKASVVRIYLPPDANTLLSVTDHCLRSQDYVNVIVAGKQPTPQWLDMDAAVRHCTAGIGIWPWASNDLGGQPDVVMACCGDTPTLETLAAVDLLRQHCPELKVRVINVVDLMKLQPQSEHPHGINDNEFDVLFTKDKPIIFAFHGYPTLIHRLTYRRTNHRNLHVRGFKEEGTTTTPFDMVVHNDMDRFHLVADVIDRVPAPGRRAAYVKQFIRDKLIEHKQYIEKHGEDMPEIRSWKWDLPHE